MVKNTGVLDVSTCFQGLKRLFLTTHFQYKSIVRLHFFVEIAWILTFVGQWTRFVRVLENLESHYGKILESSRNLFNLAKKYEAYERQ